MTKLKILLIFTTLLLVQVQSRNIRLLNTENELVPANHFELNSTDFKPKPLKSSEICYHTYKFLPCASNIPGFIFQILVLEYLLLIGDKILTKGRQQLFSILGVGIYGATIFHVLSVLPTIVLVLASGLTEKKEDAQARIENGVGLLAGSTVFNLTLNWGICILLGRIRTKDETIHKDSKDSTTNCWLATKRTISSLKGCGVKADRKTRCTAGIMLLSLIPFIMAEIAARFQSHSWSHIITLATGAAVLVWHFIFQSRHQWIQERSLQYSRDQLLLAGFLDSLEKLAKRRLVDKEGKVDISCIKKTFQNIDKNEDKEITLDELKAFLDNMKSGDLELDDEFAIKELMKHFDQDSDQKITEEEFVGGLDKFIGQAKQLVADKTDTSRHYLPRLHNMVQPLIQRKKEKLEEVEQQLSQILHNAQNQQLSFLVTDGKPDETKIRSLFAEFDKDDNNKMSVKELQVMMRAKFGSAKFDHDEVVKQMMNIFDIDNDKELHVDEFTDGMKKGLSGDSELIDQCIEKEKKSMKKMSFRALTKAIATVIVGVAIVSSLGLPLVINTQFLSRKLGIPPFFISFVILPLAVNFKTAMATIYPASQKKEEVSSIIFSEIYGAVFMNNILGLLALLALIWARGFLWEYSAEVVVLVVVTAAIGLFAYLRNAYPLWTCFFAFSFYPLSLVLFFLVRYVVGWK